MTGSVGRRHPLPAVADPMRAVPARARRQATAATGADRVPAAAASSPTRRLKVIPAGTRTRPALGAGRLDWERDGHDWPNRDASHFVHAAGMRWHVQTLGDGPALLMIHGTGAATHSWAGLAPLLAQRFTVIAPDLPGHGFTQTALWSRMSLPAISGALAALLATLRVAPAIAIGHSAGAAILTRMALDRAIAPRGLVSLNGALLPLPGWAGVFFSPAAKLLSFNPLVPRLFAWRAGDAAAVRRLIASTGSVLDARGLAMYGRLLRSPHHVTGALAMMAHWDLRPLQRELPTLGPPLVLVAGANDRTLPPAEAQRVRALLPSAELVELPGLGHLAHEERPDLVAGIVLDRARAWRVLPNGGRTP